MIVIIINNGIKDSKVGFAGEEAPRFIFPTLFGYAKRVFFVNDKEYYNPEEALQNKDLCKVSYPIKDDVIDNWVDMEKIWEFTFKEKLKVDPRKHPVLLTDLPKSSKAMREKMAEIMFETFYIPALSVKDQDLLIEYARKSTPTDRSHLAWLGGSLLASQKDFQDIFVSKEEYDLEGPVVIHRR